MKKIKGEFIMKMEEGWLEKENELGLFAWKHREILKNDRDMFVTGTKADADIKELEREYNARFIYGEIIKENGEPKMFCLMKEWGDIDISVDVWNCQARVLYKNEILTFEDEEKQEKLEELALKSVDEAGGAINWSGLYPACIELIEFVKKEKK